MPVPKSTPIERAFHIGQILSVLKHEPEFNRSKKEYTRDEESKAVGKQRELVFYMHGQKDDPALPEHKYREMLEACREELLKKGTPFQELDGVSLKEYEGQNKFFDLIQRLGHHIAVQPLTPKPR